MSATSHHDGSISLVSLVAELGDRGRVLWIGDGGVPGLCTLDNVRVESGKAPCKDLTTYEVVAVADLASLGRPFENKLDTLAKAVTGSLVVRWGPGIESSRVESVLSKRFKTVRLFAQSEFWGTILSDDDGQGVLLDEALFDRPRATAHVAVCSMRPAQLDACILTRTTPPSSPRTDASSDLYEEVESLEARLAERGTRVAELQREVELHQALVRDMVEHLKSLEAPKVPEGPEVARDAALLRRAQDENAALTLQLTRIQERCAELEAAASAKDALLTRLQLELAEVENAGSTADRGLERLQEENERLRQALLDVADSSRDPSPPRIVEGWIVGRRVMEQVRALLADLLAGEPDELLTQTVAGLELTAEETRAVDRE